MNNIVKLELPKDTTNLAGFDYGNTIYEKQVKNKINIEKEYTIEFPDHINMIASSFVQGFFSEIVESIGLLATEERTNIKSVHDNIVKNTLKKLL